MKPSCFNGSTVREPWLCRARIRASAPGHMASMGPRSENRGYAARASSAPAHHQASMGPRSENRGYGRVPLCRDTEGPEASMGPRSENRGYVSLHQQAARIHEASMGPRSENRGYVKTAGSSDCKHKVLQWVHGPRTVVMKAGGQCTADPASMGPRSENRGYARQSTARYGLRTTASMGPRSENRGYAMALPNLVHRCRASMGPRSENRGYAEQLYELHARLEELQWVHGPRTVVMPWMLGWRLYPGQELQWVHGPRTVVMILSPASRSGLLSFNGSTVREPWLCMAKVGAGRSNYQLQWVHGPRTVVMPRVWKFWCRRELNPVLREVRGIALAGPAQRSLARALLLGTLELPTRERGLAAWRALSPDCQRTSGRIALGGRFHHRAARGASGDGEGRNKPRPKWHAWPRLNGPRTGAVNVIRKPAEGRRTPSSPRLSRVRWNWIGRRWCGPMPASGSINSTPGNCGRCRSSSVSIQRAKSWGEAKSSGRSRFRPRSLG